MTRLGIQSLAAALLAGFVGIASVRSEPSAQVPDFKEVYDLVAAHLSGITAADLNRTSVQALVSALSPRVSLAGGEDAAASGVQPVSKTSIFEGQIAYLRVTRVSPGLPETLHEA